MSKTKAKAMTFRQRLRAQADERLTKIEETIKILVVESIKPVSEINPYDVMRLISSGQAKTLRQKLINELANETEADLEKIYNNQQKMDLGDCNDD